MGWFLNKLSKIAYEDDFDYKVEKKVRDRHHLKLRVRATWHPNNFGQAIGFKPISKVYAGIPGRWFILPDWERLDILDPMNYFLNGLESGLIAKEDHAELAK